LITFDRVFISFKAVSIVVCDWCTAFRIAYNKSLVVFSLDYLLIVKNYLMEDFCFHNRCHNFGENWKKCEKVARLGSFFILLILLIRPIMQLFPFVSWTIKNIYLSMYLLHSLRIDGVDNFVRHCYGGFPCFALVTWFCL